MQRKVTKTAFSILALLLLGGVFLGFTTQSKADQTPAKQMMLAPNTAQQMCSADYWIAKMENPNQILMTSEEIAAYNEAILNKAETGTYKLAELPSEYNGIKMKQKLAGFSEYKDRYWDGVPVSPEDYTKIRQNILNAEASEQMQLRYGFGISYSDLKQVPVEHYFAYADDAEYDSSMNSTVQVNEPLVVYLDTADKKFSYISTPYYEGWVKSENIAVCKSKEEWLQAQEMQDFLVVTGEKIYLEPSKSDPDISERCLHMGTVLELVQAEDNEQQVVSRVPWYNYLVKLPCRDAEGYFVQKIVPIPYNRDVHVGYLEMTSANILRQAYKFLGNRYGWGGMLNAEDCSGYVGEVYRTFGLKFGRDVCHITASPSGVRYMDINDTVGKKKMLDNTLPGALVAMGDSHIMIYLGQENGYYYVINAVMNGITTKKAKVNTVIINELNDCQWIDRISKIAEPWKK